MQYEAACAQIRDDIARLLLGLTPRTSGATYSAARATRDIADALHHAAGMPDDPRWAEALASLRTFLECCTASTAVRSSAALRELRGFLEENADLSIERFEPALAS
jgi:DNA-binding FadR family transcriptional regulator